MNQTYRSRRAAPRRAGGEEGPRRRPRPGPPRDRVRRPPPPPCPARPGRRTRTCPAPSGPPPAPGRLPGRPRSRSWPRPRAAGPAPRRPGTFRRLQHVQLQPLESFAGELLQRAERRGRGAHAVTGRAGPRRLVREPGRGRAVPGGGPAARGPAEDVLDAEGGQRLVGVGGRRQLVQGAPAALLARGGQRGGTGRLPRRGHGASPVLHRGRLSGAPASCCRGRGGGSPLGAAVPAAPPAHEAAPRRPRPHLNPAGAARPLGGGPAAAERSASRRREPLGGQGELRARRRSPPRPRCRSLKGAGPGRITGHREEEEPRGREPGAGERRGAEGAGGGRGGPRRSGPAGRGGAPLPGRCGCNGRQPGRSTAPPRPVLRAPRGRPANPPPSPPARPGGAFAVAEIY